MFLNMKREETSRMIEEENIINNKKIKTKINIKYYERKNNFYFYGFYTLLIIFLILSIFTDIDNTKRITRTNILTESRYYLKNCTKGILINNNIESYNKNNPIKISVIIPVYNCEKTIKAAIRSIQNQNMENIEIILVNDFSKDSSLAIIKELMKEDPRIKLINNEKNMGALYSRNVGILEAKGEYVMTLDNDDMYMTKDVFDAIYDEAKITNFDIIGFVAVDGPNYDYIIFIIASI